MKDILKRLCHELSLLKSRRQLKSIMNAFKAQIEFTKHFEKGCKGKKLQCLVYILATPFNYIHRFFNCQHLSHFAFLCFHNGRTGFGVVHKQHVDITGSLVGISNISIYIHWVVETNHWIALVRVHQAKVIRLRCTSAYKQIHLMKRKKICKS